MRTLIVGFLIGLIFHVEAQAALEWPPEIQLLLVGSLQRLPADPHVGRGRTPFRKLAGDFEKARLPAIESLRGWYAGRCFFLDSPTRGVAALLAVENTGEDQSNGPAFSTADYRRVIPLISPEAEATYFDDLDSLTGPKLAAKQKNVNEALKRYLAQTAYPVRSGQSLLVQGLRSADFESRDYLFRRDKHLLFLKLECTETSYCMNYLNELPTNRVISFEGESPIYCYYFKRIKK